MRGLRGPQSHSRFVPEHKSLGGSRGKPGPINPAPWDGVFQRNCAHGDASGPGPNRGPPAAGFRNPVPGKLGRTGAAWAPA